MRSLQRNLFEGVLRCRRGSFLGMKSGTGSLHFWVSGPYQLWPLCGQPLGTYDWSGPQYMLGLRVGGHCGPFSGVPSVSRVGMRFESHLGHSVIPGQGPNWPLTVHKSAFYGPFGAVFVGGRWCGRVAPSLCWAVVCVLAWRRRARRVSSPLTIRSRGPVGSSDRAAAMATDYGCVSEYVVYRVADTDASPKMRQRRAAQSQTRR